MLASVVHVSFFSLISNGTHEKSLRAIHKRCPQSEGRGLSIADNGGGGVLQMRTSALFGAKNFGCFEIYGVSVGGGGLRQCGHFSDKVRGSIFRDFVRTSFMAVSYHYSNRVNYVI